MKKRLLLLVGLISIMVFSLCGCMNSEKPGENEAKGILNTKYNNSIETMEYTCDPSNGFAFAEFKLKNKDRNFKEYFFMENSKLSLVDLTSEEGQVAKVIIDSNSKNFREDMEQYRLTKTLMSKHNIDFAIVTECIERNTYGRLDPASWIFMEQDSHKANKSLKIILEQYNKLPKNVKKLVKLPMEKYIVVEVNGTLEDVLNVTGSYHFTDQYPEIDN